MDYTFTNFVAGSANQLAHAAALAVAKAPAQVYNPLFIYGGRGLGKTHLLHAIGHYIRQHGPHQRIVYLPAERFVSDLTYALQHQRMETFRHRLRGIDVLLCDDLQFLAGKQRSQEEFLHTFDALYTAGRQVVLTSDRPPLEMTPLDHRLRSRFAAGLIADIQPPDLETRLAILHKKAEAYGVHIPPDAAMAVAARLRTDVRDLERCLMRMITHASLHAQRIDLRLAETVLQQMLAERERAITAPRIQQIVAEYFGIETRELTSKRRQRSITFPRQVAMFLCRELTNASLPEIGQYFGGKDHTTVLHSCTKIARLQEDDERVARILWQLRRALEG